MSYFGTLYQNEELSHRARSVYMYLHDRSDAAGICWPSIKTVAADLKLSRRTVQRALNDLEQAGLVTRQLRHRPNGSLTSNQYQIQKKISQSPAKGKL